LNLEVDKEAGKVTLRLDRSKILTHGKPAVGRLLLELHMWRCTGDYRAAKQRYESLTEVTDEWIGIQDAMAKRQNGKSKAWAFVAGNTFLTPDGNVELKEYAETPLGLIQSWADRFPASSQSPSL
jgi:dipeptidyl-peptidase III